MDDQQYQLHPMSDSNAVEHHNYHHHQQHQSAPPIRVHLDNIPTTLPPEQLAERLHAFGALTDVRVFTDQSGQPVPRGYADFVSTEGCQAALVAGSITVPLDGADHIIKIMSGEQPRPHHHRHHHHHTQQPSTASLTEAYSKQQRDVEGLTTSYIIVRTASFEDILFSAEIGLWPISSASVAAELQDYYSRGTDDEPRPVVLIAMCEDKNKCIGYMYMSSKVAHRTEMSERMPEKWESVCRVSWARIGPMSYDMIRNHVNLTPRDQEIVLSAVDGTVVEAALGKQMCNLLDDASGVKVLPNRERMRSQYQANGVEQQPLGHHHHHHFHDHGQHFGGFNRRPHHHHHHHHQHHQQFQPHGFHRHYHHHMHYQQHHYQHHGNYQTAVDMPIGGYPHHHHHHAASSWQNNGDQHQEAYGDDANGPQ